ncbi:class I SAM-dependent methyltransferase [Gorillibacterium sp. CAU 1737]|uniref:class I SAM-dependent methyltransferase n=1 Tax=Gorillibacterium sp. CAU 1737 TaxID=3140362 RepID=UPI0032612F43
MADGNTLAIKLNKSMVSRMEKGGHLRHPNVRDAFLHVYRHWFLPNEPLIRIYSDKVIYTKVDQNQDVLSSSTSPLVMATMLEMLQVQPDQSILEIGTGTGYNAALLGYLTGEQGAIVTIDIEEDVAARAARCLSQHHYDWVRVVAGDGFLGLRDHAPYDKIIVTVGTWGISPEWIYQLKMGGDLVMPLSIGGMQVLTRFVKTETGLSGRITGYTDFLRFRTVLRDSRKTLPFDDHFTLVTEAEDAKGLLFIKSCLEKSPERHRTGIVLESKDEADGMLLWLQARMQNLFQVSGPTQAMTERFGSPLHSSGFQGMAVGAFDRNGVCLLGVQEQQCLQLVILCFADGRSTWDNMERMIQEWQQAGRPGITAVRLHVDEDPMAANECLRKPVVDGPPAARRA